GSASDSSSETHANGVVWESSASHCASRVVLPYPAGAETSVRSRPRPSRSRSTRRGLGTEVGRSRGARSFDPRIRTEESAGSCRCASSSGRATATTVLGDGTTRRTYGDVRAREIGVQRPLRLVSAGPERLVLDGGSSLTPRPTTRPRGPALCRNFRRAPRDMRDRATFDASGDIHPGDFTGGRGEPREAS